MRPLPRWADSVLLPILNVTLAFLIGGLIVAAVVLAVLMKATEKQIAFGTA